MNVEIFKVCNLNLLDIKYLTSATAEKSDSQGKFISFGLRGIPKNTEISFGKIHDYSIVYIAYILYYIIMTSVTYNLYDAMKRFFSFFLASHYIPSPCY